MTSPCCSENFEVHGLLLRVTSDVPAILETIAGRLSHFPRLGDDNRRADITFELQSVAGREAHAISKPAAPMRRICDLKSGETGYIASKDQIYVDCAASAVRVLCDPRAGRVWVSMASSDPETSWLAAYPMLTFPLLEMLKRRGLFALHAAGLCRNGKGIVLAGGSGSGKSTLAIALLKAGYEFLGDDLILLAAREGGGLRLLAMPDQTDATAETVALYPELLPHLRPPLPNGRCKYPVRPESVYGARIRWECKPAALVFPAVAHTAGSVLKPMGRQEALLELAPNVILTHPGASQAHLDAIGELARTAAHCCRLETGFQLEQATALISEMLQ